MNTVNVKPKAKLALDVTPVLLQKLSKSYHHLQLILKTSGCLLLKLNNLRRKHIVGIRVYKPTTRAVLVI